MATYYMVKTLTKEGNSFGFNGTNVTLEFDTEITKIQENIEKKMAASIYMPMDFSDYGNFAPETKLIDLKQVRWGFSLQGNLTNDSTNITNLLGNTNAAVTATAINKKNCLIAFAEQGGSLLFYHRNFGADRPIDDAHPSNITATSETALILSMSFDDSETEVGSSEDAMKAGEARLAFSIMLERGNTSV